jgi:hypothetical protein
MNIPCGRELWAMIIGPFRLQRVMKSAGTPGDRGLKRANEIPKRAASFFRGGTRPPTQEVVAFIDDNRGEFGSSPSAPSSVRRQIGHPELVGRDGGEIPAHQIGDDAQQRGRAWWCASGCRAVLRRSRGPHEPADLVTADLITRRDGRLSTACGLRRPGSCPPTVPMRNGVITASRWARAEGQGVLTA